jgi:hypothetical protein
MFLISNKKQTPSKCYLNYSHIGRLNRNSIINPNSGWWFSLTGLPWSVTLSIKILLSKRKMELKIALIYRHKRL